MSDKRETGRLTAIINAHIFDGKNEFDNQTVVIKEANILSVGTGVPESATVVDAQGMTLLPGLIDAHVHTDMSGLRTALSFGVTTELDMQGYWSKRKRRKISQCNDVADLRSPGMGITPAGGHPSEYMHFSRNLLIRLFFRFPFVNTPEEAVKFVNKRVSEGADYIKIFIENGDCVGFPGLPIPSDEVIRAAVKAAHHRGKLIIAHVTTAAGAQKAIDTGVDGLGHLFFDEFPSQQLIENIVSSGVFIIPTLVTISSALGNDASMLASDKRVSSRLDKKWLAALSRSMNVYPQGIMENVFSTIKTLHSAGVDILAGTDVAEPIPILGGLAHGASLHHELQLLVAAGLEPVEALRATTSVPARRFRLNGKGKIAQGTDADLLLVKGNPLADISDTLSICEVWRRGERLNRK
jgi:imidazolonepropionase-like amidohydrolase